MSKEIKFAELKLHEDNPRLIKTPQFEKQLRSMICLPQMLKLRGLIRNRDGSSIVEANLAYLAPVFKGLLRAEWVEDAFELTPGQEREVIIKDNTHFGEWDYDAVANEWDGIIQDDWGLDVWKPDEDVDLDDFFEEQSEGVNDKSGDAEKALLIPFKLEHYKEALDLVKFWFDQDLYLGGFLMEKMKAEKEKLENGKN